MRKLLSLRLVRDKHNGLHPMKDGACHCDCEQCVTIVHALTPQKASLYHCICPRCDQNCTGFGRLGYIDQVRDEREAGYPGIVPGWKYASRWYWTRRYYGKRRK